MKQRNHHGRGREDFAGSDWRERETCIEAKAQELCVIRTSRKFGLIGRGDSGSITRTEDRLNLGNRTGIDEGR